jgi:hypothetical protein
MQNPESQFDLSAVAFELLGQGIQVFKHGRSDNPQYVLPVQLKH